MEILNRNANEVTTLRLDSPYPVWVIDNFLNDMTLRMIHDRWPKLDDQNWHGGHEMIDGEKNILEQGMISYDTSDTRGILHDFIEYIHGDEFTERLEDITGIGGLVPDYHMRWSGIRTMVKDGFQAVHSDARVSPETGLRKELTCLIYFNEDWKPKDSGYFEVWNDDMTKCTHSLAPLNNRLVIFQNSDKSYYGVPEVNKERKSITWSVLKSGKVGDRSKALFVSRPQDDKKVGELGKKRALVKDAHK